MEVVHTLRSLALCYLIVRSAEGRVKRDTRSDTKRVIRDMYRYFDIHDSQKSSPYFSIRSRGRLSGHWYIYSKKSPFVRTRSSEALAYVYSYCPMFVAKTVTLSLLGTAVLGVCLCFSFHHIELQFYVITNSNNNNYL